MIINNYFTNLPQHIYQKFQTEVSPLSKTIILVASAVFALIAALLISKIIKNKNDTLNSKAKLEEVDSEGVGSEEDIELAPREDDPLEFLESQVNVI